MNTIILLLSILIASVSYAADTKITALTADTTPTTDDLMVTVNDPGGTPANRKATIAQVFKAGDITINGTNVGVGSTTPTEKLDVNGTVRATSFAGTGSGNSYITNGNLGVGTVTAGKQLTIGSTGQTNFASDGNLGIGTVNAPTTLYVAGVARMQGFSLPGNGAASGYVLTSNSVGVGTWMPSSGSGVSGITTNYIPKAASSTSLTDSVMYASGSNIGVGTTNPGVVFDVNGSARFSGSGDSYLNASSGNVGIGTTAPNYAGLTIGASKGIHAVGIGTTVPQQLCRDAIGRIGYFNGAWASSCTVP